MRLGCREGARTCSHQCDGKVIVLEGAGEILRLAKLHNVDPFEFAEGAIDDESG